MATGFITGVSEHSFMSSVQNICCRGADVPSDKMSPDTRGDERCSCSGNVNPPKLKLFQVLFHTFVVSQLLTAIYHHLSRSDLKRRSPKEQVKISVNR